MNDPSTDWTCLDILFHNPAKPSYLNENWKDWEISAYTTTHTYACNPNNSPSYICSKNHTHQTVLTIWSNGIGNSHPNGQYSPISMISSLLSINSKGGHRINGLNWFQADENSLVPLGTCITCSTVATWNEETVPLLIVANHTQLPIIQVVGSATQALLLWIFLNSSIQTWGFLCGYQWIGLCFSGISYWCCCFCSSLISTSSKVLEDEKDYQYHKSCKVGKS